MPLVILLLLPAFCLAPCDARLLVRIEPHSANRLLRIEWAEGASERQLDGAKAPRHWRFDLRRLSESTDVVVALIDADGTLRARASRRIEVH